MQVKLSVTEGRPDHFGQRQIFCLVVLQNSLPNPLSEVAELHGLHRAYQQR